MRELNTTEVRPDGRYLCRPRVARFKQLCPTGARREIRSTISMTDASVSAAQNWGEAHDSPVDPVFNGWRRPWFSVGSAAFGASRISPPGIVATLRTVDQVVQTWREKDGAP